MKDDWTRDKRAAKTNVVFFEMEEAGLMNHFPAWWCSEICVRRTHQNKQQ